MKLFEGVVKEAAGNRVILVETGSGETLSLKGGEAVLQQARGLIGKRVRFQAHLHESSIFLAAPIFVVGSSYGLVAVREETPGWEREKKTRVMAELAARKLSAAEAAE